MESFDLAERLQTPIILMSDLDLGMNEWTTSPLKIDESKDGIEVKFWMQKS